MSTPAITFDKKEEADLLMGWFETVQFDKPSKGIPDVDYPDDAEEDSADPGDGEKAFDSELEEKAVRHVRTPAGQRRYGQPIGSIIVRDGNVLQNITIGKPKYTGFQHVSDHKGNEYDVGRHDGKWIATRSGSWDVVVSASSEEGVYEALDKHVGGGPTPKAPAAPKKTPAARNAAPQREQAVKFRVAKSEYPAYDKYEGDDGKASWYTIGQVGREYRRGMWSGQRPSTAGMYHITDTRGHYLNSASPNLHIQVDEATVKGNEQHRVKTVSIGGYSGIGGERPQAALPSEYAKKHLGMPEPKMMNGHDVAIDDPNYGYPAIAEKMQQKIDRTMHDPTKAELMLERSRFLLDKAQALEELQRARQFRTADPRWGSPDDRVLQRIDAAIERLRNSKYAHLALELKDLIAELEEKVKHVRTAAGARRYNLPIGSPIPDRALPPKVLAPNAGTAALDSGKPVRARVRGPKLSPEMQAHRDGFRKLQRRFSDYPALGEVAKIIADRITNGKIENEAHLNAELRDALSPEIIQLLFSRVKGQDFFDLEVKEIQDTIEGKADGEVHTGAMIALIPSEADAARLADEENGGEEQGELHVTLKFLGKASNISQDARESILQGVGRMAYGQLGYVKGRLFGANIFNPNGDEPCFVIGVGDAGEPTGSLGGLGWMLSGVVGVMENVHYETGFRNTDSHTPWVPHITIRYFKDGNVDMDWVKKQFAKVNGEVTFDRLRVAFGGMNVDFPLREFEPQSAESAMKALVWAACTSVMVEEKAPVITPGGRVGDDSSHNFSPRENWVDKRGGLPRYIKIIRNGIMDKNPTMSEGRATALAVSSVKKWAAGRGNVSPKVRAAAAAAVAQWEAMKATKASPDQPTQGGSYVSQRMQQAHRSSLGSQGAVDDFNHKHPRSQGGKFGNKPNSGRRTATRKRDTAHTIAESMASKLPAKYGQQSQTIQQIQVVLRTLGFDVEDDGIYGDKMVAAVKQFQKQMGLKETGTVDAQTMEAMLNKARQGSSTRNRK